MGNRELKRGLNKLSQSHVEVIISFVLFVGTLSLIFIFINPLSQPERKVFYFKSAQTKVIENISEGFDELSIIVKDEEDCYDGDVVRSYGTRFIEILDTENPRKYTIYYGDIFEEGGEPSCLGGDIDYSLGVFSNETIIYEKKIEELKNNYETDYNALREFFGISSDFSFSFKYIHESADIWWNSSWKKRKEIKIESVSNFKDFPVYIKVPKEGEMQNDYDDLRFIKNGEMLNYEIEKYSTGEAEVWVKVPTLSKGGNFILMYYDNPEAVSEENISGVWDDNFKGVWHLGEDAKDSSINNNDGILKGAPGPLSIQGKIGNATDFDGGNDWINISENDSLDFGADQDYSIEFWIKHPEDMNPNEFQRFLQKAGDGGSGFVGYNFETEHIDYKIKFWSKSISDEKYIKSQTVFHDDVWRYVVGVREDSNIYLYVNGLRESSGVFDSGDLSNSADLRIGHKQSNDPHAKFFEGGLDEIRISDKIRSEKWVEQSYKIVKEQDSFINIGGEESYDSGYIQELKRGIPKLSVEAKTPTGLERDSVEFPVRVMDDSGEIKELILNIMTW